MYPLFPQPLDHARKGGHGVPEGPVDVGQQGALSLTAQQEEKDVGLNGCDAPGGQTAADALFQLNVQPSAVLEQPLLIHLCHMPARLSICLDRNYLSLNVYTTAILACEIQMCYIL